MTNFNPAQQSVIASTYPNIVCLAGPGAGKSRTVVGRIQRLLADGTPPSRICAITFTNAAADVLTERLAVKLGYCGTLHGLMLRLLQSKGNLIGFSGRITILDEDETKAHRDEIISQIAYKGSLTAFEEALALGMPVTTRGPLKTIQIAVAAYYRALIKSNTLDFDSILVLGHLLLTKTQPDPTFTHLFWDEFQDSGDWDAKIRHALIIPNKTTVGDPDQSVYAFRGANVRHIMQAAAGDAQIVYLEENYRSDRRICADAQALIEHNTGRIAKKTISISPNEGSIDVHLDHTTAGREIACLAADIDAHKCHEDAAVLVRSNFLVQQIARELRGFGIPIAERPPPPETIPDWKKAKLFLSLLANPDNNFVARRWLTVKDGEREANRITLSAMAAKQTVNNFHLKLPVMPNIGLVIELLHMNGIAQAAISTMFELQKELPENSTFLDLIIAMSRDNDAAQPIGKGVVVSTMHGAKGKEWGTVYLPAFEQKIIPSERKTLDLEEERRIAYVAVTRARHRLVISAARERQGEWERRPAPATPSQFVGEMGLAG